MPRNERRKILLELYETLGRAFGPMRWWPAATDSSFPHGSAATPFEVCIGAILTQNAPWLGVVKAIRNLKESGLFGVEEIDRADERVLAETIRPAIYRNQKARRLKGFCRFLLDMHEGRVEHMIRLETAEARRQLLALDGVGFETADSMLLYALGMPVFVVDAYTKRVLVRHRLADVRWGYEEIRSSFERVLDPDPVVWNEFHALLCRLGAGFCGRKPNCMCCPAGGVLGVPYL